MQEIVPVIVLDISSITDAIIQDEIELIEKTAWRVKAKKRKLKFQLLYNRDDKLGKAQIRCSSKHFKILQKFFVMMAQWKIYEIAINYADEQGIWNTGTVMNKPEMKNYIFASPFCHIL